MELGYGGDGVMVVGLAVVAVAAVGMVVGVVLEWRLVEGRGEGVTGQALPSLCPNRE